MSRETRRTVLYDTHKKPVELDTSKLPSFRKVSCHSISDDCVSITAVTTTNNSAHREPTTGRKFIKIPPISFDSSLPSTSTVSRGGGGGGGKKRQMTRGPLHPAKKGKSDNYHQSRRDTAPSMSDFDILAFDYQQAKLQTSSQNTAPPGSTRVGGDTPDDEVFEIADSPPPRSSEHAKTVAHSPTPSSCSSTSELIAVQLTSRQHDPSPSDDSLPSPSLPNRPTSTRHYTSAQVISSSHTLTPNEPISQGHPPNQTWGSRKDCVDVDTEDDCQITQETTTTSRYFGNKQTEREGVNNSFFLPPSSPGTTNDASNNPELIQLKKAMANFSRVTNNLPHLSASSPPTLSRPPLLPTPPAHRQQSMLHALEEFNSRDQSSYVGNDRGRSSDVGNDRGQTSDLGSDNHRGNDRDPSISVPTSVVPRLTNPELDDEEEDVLISATSKNTRWAERRGGGGGGGGGRGGGGEGGRGRGGGGSVFDILEKGSSRQNNASSFYGGGGGAPTYGQQQLMAVKETNNKKKRLSLRDTLRGRQPPHIRAPPHTVRQLDFTSTGKTLISLQKRGQQSDSNRMGTKVKRSGCGSTGLSMIDEFNVDVGTVRIGTLEDIHVSQCLFTSGEICMKLVAKDTPLKYNIYLSYISEWKMNLGESPRCIMLKLHPLAARKQANKLRSQFRLSNQRFLNVEGQSRWNWYWILRIEHNLAPNTVAQIHQWVNTLESRVGEAKIRVNREMSVDEVSEFYAELKGQQTVSLFSSQPSEVYKPPPCLREMPREDIVRRSSRIQNKDGDRERGRERLRKMINEEGEEEEEEGAVTYVPKGDPKKIILTYKPEGTRVNIEISEMDLDCLHPGVYLNDRVIDFYLMYLWYDELGTEVRDRVHIFSSFFHQRLMDSTRDMTGSKELSVAKRLHDRVKSWTRHVDLFTKDYVILPVCVSSHWFLALICYPGRFKPAPPPMRNRKRRKGRFRPKVSRSTRSRAKEEGKVTAMELINISYSQEEGEEGEGETPRQRNNGDCRNVGAAGTKDGDVNIHFSSCEEDERLGVRGEGEEEEEEEEGEKEGDEMECVMMEEEEEGETVSSSSQTLESGGEKPEEKEQEENKPCIMILDSLEIRRGAIVTRINNYLTEEWEVKRKDRPPMKFKLKALHPKLLPQNNSCDCGVFVLQYVESLFQCLKRGHPPPSMPDDWASYHQTQTKRQQLVSLIRGGAKPRPDPAPEPHPLLP